MKLIIFIFLLTIIYIFGSGCKKENPVEQTQNRIFRWFETMPNYNRGLIYVLEANSYDMVFAGCHLYNGEGGIYRTTNQGFSWELSGCNNYSTENIYIDKYGIIWATFYNGSVYNSEEYYYRSNDNGKTWIKVDVVEPNSVHDYVNKTIVISEETMVVGTESLGIYRSTDGGNNWKHANNGILQDDRWIRAMIKTPTDIIYLLASNSAYIKLYKSVNKGISWDSLTSPSKYCSILVCQPKSNNIIAATSDSVFISTDNCSSWIASNIKIKHNCYIVGIVSDKYDNLYLAATNGIYRSVDNGNQWILEDAGLPSEEVRSICIDGRGYLYAGICDGRIFRTVEPVNK